MNDNVKKIFEMLGVEPNEEFEIEGKEDKFYFNEVLTLLSKDEKGKIKHCFYDLGTFIKGKFKIIKLPKEPTFIELMNWKPKVNETYHYVDSCNHVKTNRNECWVIDEQIIEHNKPYPTREMAERRKDIKGQYQKLGYKFTVKEWGNRHIPKYALFINHIDKRVGCSEQRYIQESDYTFKTLEQGIEFNKFLGATEQERYENACLYL